MIHVVTLAYANPGVLEVGVDRFYSSLKDDKSPFSHYLVNQHYPKETYFTASILGSLLTRYGAHLLDPGKNLGFHHGINWAIQQICPDSKDTLLIFDADSLSVRDGWLSVIDQVMFRGWDVVGLMDPRTEKELKERGFVRHYAGEDHELWEPLAPTVISVAGYSVAMLQKIGGLNEHNAYYGGLEADLWPKMKKIGARIGYLVNYKESHKLRDMADRPYKEYKYAHAVLRIFPGSFEEWLAQDKKSPEAPEVLP